jgi:hypothetical protein
MRTLIVAILLAAISASIFGQQTAPGPSPVPAKRLPPEKSKSKTRNDVLLDQYDFGAQISALQETDTNPPSAGTVHPIPPSSSAPPPPGESAVPAGFRPRTDVYDTAAGRYVLIPQGSRLVGVYNSRIGYGHAGVAYRDDPGVFATGAGSQ